MRRGSAKRIAGACLCLCLAGVGAGAVAAAAGADDAGGGRLLALTRGVAGLARIDVHAGTGTVALQGTVGRELLVSVRLTPGEAAQSAPGGAEGADASLAAGPSMASAVLTPRAEGGELYMQVTYPPGSDATVFSEAWTVSVPAGLAVEVEMASGRLFSRGVEGDLDLHLGVGTIKVASRDRAVSARVSYGDVFVDAASYSAGRLHAAAATGTARVSVDGRTLPVRRPPPGALVMEDLGGVHDFMLQTDVGDVVLELRRTAAPDPPRD